MRVTEKGCTGIHCTEARVAAGSSPGSGLGVRKARTWRLLLRRTHTASVAKERQGANAWVFYSLCVESPNF